MQHRNHSAIEPQKTIHKQHSKITTRAEDSGMGSHSGKAKLKPKKVEFAIKKNCKNWPILRFPPYTRRGDCRVFRLPLNLQRHYCKFTHPASLCRAIQFIPFFTVWRNRHWKALNRVIYFVSVLALWGRAAWLFYLLLTTLCSSVIFYRASASLCMQSAIMLWKIRPSVCLSHCGTGSKRMHIASNSLRRLTAAGLVFWSFTLWNPTVLLFCSGILNRLMWLEHNIW